MSRQFSATMPPLNKTRRRGDKATGRISASPRRPIPASSYPSPMAELELAFLCVLFRSQLQSLNNQPSTPNKD